jgi:hypothetical protein
MLHCYTHRPGSRPSRSLGNPQKMWDSHRSRKNLCSAKITEPEFSNTLKWQLGWKYKCKVSNKSANIQFKLLTYLELFGKLLFFYLINIRIFENNTKKCSCLSPVVFFDLWKDSSSWKVDFSASSKCLRIRALDRLCTNFFFFFFFLLQRAFWYFFF